MAAERPPPPPNMSAFEGATEEGKFRALIEWIWAFYNASVIGGFFAEASALAAITDPAGATAATAQATANSAVVRLNNIQSGQVTVTNGVVVGTATYTLEFDDTNYEIILTPVSDTNGPAAGSNRVLTVSKTVTGFTVTVETDPGGTATVSFDYIAIRQPA